MNDGLGQLAHGNFSFGDEYCAGQTRLHRVCGSTGRCIPRRGANDRFCTLECRIRDCHGHAAIFERTRWVGTFVFEPDGRTDHLTDGAGVDEWRATLAKTHDGCGLRKWHAIAVLLDYAAPLVCHLLLTLYSHYPNHFAYFIH